MKSLFDRLGVCSWSLQALDANALVRQLETIGLNRVQIDLDAIRTLPEKWKNLPDLCNRQHLHIASGMFRCVGEDYSTLQSIRETGGLLPDETWQDTWDVAQASADLGKQLGLKIVSFHAGFIPEEESDPVYEKLLHRIRLVADFCASRGIDIALETGQESALTLKTFLEHVGRINVGVNFDPANMLIYGMGNPIDAVEVLSPWIKQAHIKDGVQPTRSGILGHETRVGDGEVDWKDFILALQHHKIPGDLFIERESGDARVADIRHARDFLEPLLKAELAASA